MNITSITRSHNPTQSDPSTNLVAAAAAPNSTRRRLVSLGAALTLAGATFLSVAPTMAGANEGPSAPVAAQESPTNVVAEQPQDGSGATGGNPGEPLVPVDTGGDTSGGTDGQTTGGDTIGDTSGGTDGDEPECNNHPKKVWEECPPPAKPECPEDEGKHPKEPRPLDRPEVPVKEERLVRIDEAELTEIPEWDEHRGVPVHPEYDTPEYPEHCDEPEIPEIPEIPEVPEVPETPEHPTPDVKVNVGVDRPVLASPNFTG